MKKTIEVVAAVISDGDRFFVLNVRMKEN